MHLLWESELVQKSAPLEVEALLEVSGAAELLTQTCRNKQAWEIISICSRTQGGCPCPTEPGVCGAVQRLARRSPARPTGVQSVKGECANC